ncbi:MAG TPA: hypothetical protein VL282_05575, partial [Tepidisphaeraceae bacterium]|nr:hypothetical protein [Tepidisphaeraceae bacterium]
PKNQKRFIEAVTWAGNETFALSVSAPEYIAVEARKNSAGDLILHLLNYSPAKKGAVSVNLKGNLYRQATLWSPKTNGPKALKLTKSRGGLACKVSAVDRYVILQVQS